MKRIGDMGIPSNHPNPFPQLEDAVDDRGMDAASVVMSIFPASLKEVVRPTRQYIYIYIN